MNWTRAIPVFSATFAVLYVIAITYNLALFTYHPSLNRFEFLVGSAQGGVSPMFWYGWLTTSALGALLAAAVSLAVPSNWTATVWSGWTWVLPVVSMLYITYVIRDYFLR
jgi:hypothetical protein